MTTKHVLVTRPSFQGASLCCLLRDRGFRVTHVPVMEIATLDTPDQITSIQKIFSQIESFDGLVFISVNAAEMALPWLEKFPLSRSTRLFAVGKTTATYLDERVQGNPQVFYPLQDMSSEGLLAMHELQAAEVQDRRYLILRGSGGRELIAQTLKERGALVDNCELYRRYLPEQNAAALKKCLPEVDMILVNSGEALENLLTLAGISLQAGVDEKFFQKTLIVPGERVAEAARKTGFRHIIRAVNATDDAVLEALL